LVVDGGAGSGWVRQGKPSGNGKMRKEKSPHLEELYSKQQSVRRAYRGETYIHVVKSCKSKKKKAAVMRQHVPGL